MDIHPEPSSDNLEGKSTELLTLHANYLDLIEADKDRFSCIALDEEHLAVARVNGKINIYEINRKGNTKLMFTILGNSSSVYTMLIHNRLLFTGDSIEDALIKIWEVDTGRLVRALKGHAHPIMCISAYSNSLIASASCD